MTVVTYNVVIHTTIDIDAEDLIDECARDIVESCVDDMNARAAVTVHDIDIEVE